MPELPEVEAVVQHLAPILEGKVCSRVSMPASYTKALSGASAATVTRVITQQKIIRVFRRAKYILLEFTQGHYLTIHLRMTGRLLFELEPGDKNYVTAWIHFTDGTTLYFKDVRKFGRLQLLDSLDPLEAKLGPEPLSAEFSVPWLRTALQRSSRKIKPLLLDQSFIAGLGNIYVDEVLFAAAIHPETAACTIPDSAVRLLQQAIRRTIKKAISFNGTTFQSFYFGEEQSGEFTSYLKVFGKEGTPCPRCGDTIIKTRVAQRGTHLCPTCQEMP